VPKYNINVDAEFAALVPAMVAEERAQLKANIAAEGLREKIIVWRVADDFLVVDGHTRLSILNELALEQPELPLDEYDVFSEKYFQSRDFTDREAVKLWILENQVGRRNLTKDQRIKMVADIVILRQESTAKIQQGNLKKGRQTPEVPKTGTSGKTVKSAAQEFQVPRQPLQDAVTSEKSNRALLREEYLKTHPEDADKPNAKIYSLAVAAGTTVPKKIMKHFVDAQVGDELNVYGSAGGHAETITKIDTEQGRVYTTRGKKNLTASHDLYGNVGPVRENNSKKTREAIALAKTGDADAIKALAAVGLDAHGNKHNAPQPPATETLSGTFYVIRRKSDGNFLDRENAGFTRALQFASGFTELDKEDGELPEILSQHEWEWVSVQATYKLTAQTETAESQETLAVRVRSTKRFICGNETLSLRQLKRLSSATDRPHDLSHFMHTVAKGDTATLRLMAEDFGFQVEDLELVPISEINIHESAVSPSQEETPDRGALYNDILNLKEEVVALGMLRQPNYKEEIVTRRAKVSRITKSLKKIKAQRPAEFDQRADETDDEYELRRIAWLQERVKKEKETLGYSKKSDATAQVVIDELEKSIRASRFVIEHRKESAVSQPKSEAADMKTRKNVSF
jgi:hypothetical protein